MANVQQKRPLESGRQSMVWPVVNDPADLKAGAQGRYRNPGTGNWSLHVGVEGGYITLTGVKVDVHRAG